MLHMLIFLVLIAGIGYWIFKSKEKKVPKKISIPFLIIALILLIFSMNTEDSLAATNYNNEVEKSEKNTKTSKEINNNSEKSTKQTKAKQIIKKTQVPIVQIMIQRKRVKQPPKILHKQQEIVRLKEA